MEPHRSFRFIAVDPVRLLSGFLLAAAMSGGIAYQGPALLTIHETLRERILRWTGVPITGYARIASFGESVRTPISPVAGYAGRPWLLAGVCVFTAAVFLATYARVKLSRSLMIFALALLTISAVDTLSQSFAATNSIFFTGFWLRCEFVIWVLTPWLMAMLAFMIIPAWWVSVFWVTAAPVYAILWSSVRLAFCTGLLYYSGPVLILLLWSIFGVLADLLSLCLFYSLAIRQTGSYHRGAMPDG